MNLRDRIKEHEGFDLNEYPDSKGYPTIYWGHKVVKGEVYLHTIKDAEAYLSDDINHATKDLKNIFPDYQTFSQARQEALIEFFGCPKMRGQFAIGPRGDFNIPPFSAQPDSCTRRLRGESRRR